MLPDFRHICGSWPAHFPMTMESFSFDFVLMEIQIQVFSVWLWPISSTGWGTSKSLFCESKLLMHELAVDSRSWIVQSMDVETAIVSSDFSSDNWSPEETLLGLAFRRWKTHNKTSLEGKIKQTGDHQPCPVWSFGVWRKRFRITKWESINTFQDKNCRYPPSQIGPVFTASEHMNLENRGKSLSLIVRADAFLNEPRHMVGRWLDLHSTHCMEKLEIVCAVVCGKNRQNSNGPIESPTPNTPDGHCCWVSNTIPLFDRPWNRYSINQHDIMTSSAWSSSVVAPLVTLSVAGLDRFANISAKVSHMPQTSWHRNVQQNQHRGADRMWESRVDNLHSIELATWSVQQIGHNSSGVLSRWEVPTSDRQSCTHPLLLSHSPWFSSDCYCCHCCCWWCCCCCWHRNLHSQMEMCRDLLLVTLQVRPTKLFLEWMSNGHPEWLEKFQNQSVSLMLFEDSRVWSFKKMGSGEWKFCQNKKSGSCFTI